MKSITYSATEMEEAHEGVTLPEREEGVRGRRPAGEGGGLPGRAREEVRAMGHEEVMGLRWHASNKVRGLGLREEETRVMPTSGPAGPYPICVQPISDMY